LLQNGWAGKTFSTASGKSSHGKSSNITFQTPYNMETSKNSTQQLTLDELISLQEDSHANPTHSQESEWERKTNATCGPKCVESYGKFSRVGSWARTFAALLVGMEGWSSTRCKLTWKLKGTKSHRLYFQLVPSVRPTEGTEFGLLLTPTTREEVMDQEKFKARMEKYDNGTTVPNLATQVVGMLPTPTTGADHKTQYAQGGKSLRCYLGQSSQLSPLFVEEMMGFPKNWTALPFQSGDEKA